MLDLLFYGFLGVVVLYAVLFILIVAGDCDLYLQFAAKFGKKTSALKGKVVWITGASSGIGEYLAYELAKAGCKLCLSARREQELIRVKKECLLNGKVNENDILVLPLDVIKMETHSSATQHVLEYFNKIDILVNNAGRSQRALFEETSLDVDRGVLELNVLGVLSLTKQVLPHMLQRKEGHIVVNSSIAGKVSDPVSSSYTGSKHAIQGWFSCLAVETFDRNIAVTILCPGPVFSNIRDTAFTGKPGEEFKGKMIPSEKRMSTSRCAELCALAIANRLDEAWISINPVLLFTYIYQYFPNLARVLSRRMGLKIISKIREGNL
ncbi:dehydrogenase/reductase SDR family member 7-like [Ostrea edulis]|uniref:dehydrogenase/reductase SDR family member 7-like n=1 Tax=Ostrea edulis TaxID=37623 RepID=UPI0024AF9ED7|nr:dehydrogenase/reductase SDR family member 7-like [Ostrea edulis]XP_056020631.1 dehydrogenase/reductase SDR family member 7-like [Ostrea edulis]XP_056020632.1 dehydrogenase/reductase SDR family member 7-like [Ostrea edulis]XP_056020633.1 dehydrogenase/reductase SDR family member 7-like [Ostrea edulis]